MRHSKLILASMAIMLLFAGLLSVPALSGENPWDADNGSGGKPTPPDSAKNDASLGNGLPTGLASGNPNNDDGTLNWFSSMMMQMSFFVVERYYDWTSPKAQVKTAY